jgi:hypothetical protein
MLPSSTNKGNPNLEIFTAGIAYQYQIVYEEKKNS